MYHHWAGKKPLLAAVVVAFHQDLAREVAADGTDETDPLDQLEHAAGVFLRRCLDPDVGRVLLLEAPAVLGDAWHEIDARWWHRRTAELLQRARESGLLVTAEPDGLATALLGSLTALGRAVSLGTPSTSPETALGLLHRLIAGLRRSAGRAGARSRPRRGRP